MNCDQLSMNVLMLAFLVILSTFLGCQDLSDIEVKRAPNFSQMRASLTAEKDIDQDCVSRLGLTNTGPALVVDQRIDLSADFSLRDVLDALATTGTGPGDGLPLMASMLATYGEVEQRNPLSALDMPVDRRSGEAALDPQATVEAMEPVALFNRLDLAPADGANCGEYRIVFAKPFSGAGLPLGFFFMILEARYPNPLPEQGLAGCRSIAEFWASLENETLDDLERISMLRTFFFDGVTVGDVFLPPVLQFQNFQAPMGQIRTNHFIAFEKWQLREFRTARRDDGQAVLRADTVKDMPLTALYEAPGTPSVGLDQAQLDTLRVDYQDDLVNQQMGFILAPELNGETRPNAIRTGFSLHASPKFYEFQSDAQGSADDPSVHVTDSLKQRISAAIPTGINVNADHVMNRLGALTCGGCHRFSAGREIAPGVTWPQDAGFVHVTESGSLSPALHEVFLPQRRAFLEHYLCGTAFAPPPPEPPTPPVSVETHGFEMGVAKIQGSRRTPWTQVTFSQAFERVPAIFIVPNRRGGHPCHTRIRNVSERGFEVSCLEPAREDGPHMAMQVAFIAATPGIQSLGERTLEVGCSPTGAIQHNLDGGGETGWHSVSFQHGFREPILLAQIQSDFNELLDDNASRRGHRNFLTVAASAVSESRVNLALELSEVRPDRPVAAEEVCYAVFETGNAEIETDEGTVNCLFGQVRSEGKTRRCTRSTPFRQSRPQPLVVGFKGTRNDADGGWARYCGQIYNEPAFYIEEDRSSDRERHHDSETVFYASCQAPVTRHMTADVESVRIPSEESQSEADDNTSSVRQPALRSARQLPETQDAEPVERETDSDDDAHHPANEPF